MESMIAFERIYYILIGKIQEANDAGPILVVIAYCFFASSRSTRMGTLSMM